MKGIRIKKAVSNARAYCPKLSFLAIKFFALFLLTVSQLAVFMRFVLDGKGMAGTPLYALAEFLRGLGQITVPVLFVAMMANIFHRKDRGELPRTAVSYAIYTLLFYGAEIFLFINFVEPVFAEMLRELLLGYPGIESGMLSEIASYLLHELLYSFFSEISNFNVYIDCFLGALMYTFLFYTPENASGKKLALFRSLTALPALYVAAAFVLHGLASFGKITFSVYLGALLPHKKLVYWIFFAGVLCYLKTTDSRKTAPTLGRDDKFTDNAAVFCLLLLVAGLTDIALSAFAPLKKLGFGKSSSMLLGIPVLFFFDVRKKPRYPWAGKLTPLYYVLNYGLLWALFAGSGGLIEFFFYSWLSGLA